jgi:hypothetical protein
MARPWGAKSGSSGFCMLCFTARTIVTRKKTDTRKRIVLFILKRIFCVVLFESCEIDKNNSAFKLSYYD